MNFNFNILIIIKMNSVLIDIQSILDENKKKIPDNVYITLSNKCLTEYKKNNTNLYKIKYLYTVIIVDMVGEVILNTKNGEQIILLEETIYNRISSQINEKKYSIHDRIGHPNNNNDQLQKLIHTNRTICYNVFLEEPDNDDDDPDYNKKGSFLYSPNCIILEINKVT
jgi:hypothetical protein